MHLLLFAPPDRSGQSLRALLEEQHYRIELLPALDALSDYLFSGDYDALLVDGSGQLPQLCNGLQQLRRASCTVPVLVLCSAAGPDSCVEALDAGADDFLPRPCSSTELLARLRALLRRPAVYVPPVLQLAQLQLDSGSRILHTGDQQCRLNNKEFLLMQLFLQNPGRILSPQLLMDRVWGWDREAELPVVWTYICNLRRKLRRLHAPVQLRAVRGAGYILEQTS